MNAPTDEELLAEYLSGDVASFELFVRRHMRELHQFALRFTADSVAAEDVVQETLIQLHTSAHKFDPARRFKPWLFTIAANKARDYLRRRTRKRELPIDAYVEHDGDAGQRFIDLFSAAPRSPDDDLLLEEKRRLVKSAVDEVPQRLREVLILAYYHRFPYREMAEILDVPLGTIKSRLHAAVVRFAECYEEAVRSKTEKEP